MRFRLIFSPLFFLITGDSGKVTTVVATPGQGPDRPQEVSYTDIKVIGNGSFGVVYQARLIDSQEMVAIKKVLQDKRFKVCVNGPAAAGTYRLPQTTRTFTLVITDVLLLCCFHHSRIGSCRL